MKKIFFPALGALAGLLLGALVVEAGLRASNLWIGRHSDTMFRVLEADDTLGWLMKPNVRQTVDFVDVEGIPVRSNSIGLWDREFTPGTRRDRCRAVFLGDSFTWGLGVREEERFTNVFARTRRDWEAMNFGIPAYGTDQALLLWRRFGRVYRPDVVFLTIYENDYWDNMSVVTFGRPKPYFELREGRGIRLANVPVRDETFWDNGVYSQAAPPYAGLFPTPLERRSRVLHWLVKHSDLVRFAYTMSRPRRSEAPAPVPAARDGAPVEARLDTLARLQVRLLGEIVGEMSREVRAGGAELVVVIAGDPTSRYEAQKEVFREMGVSYVSATTEVLSRRPGARGGSLYFPYNGHWTPRGHHAVAELLSDFVTGLPGCSHRP